MWLVNQFKSMVVLQTMLVTASKLSPLSQVMGTTLEQRVHNIISTLHITTYMHTHKLPVGEKGVLGGAEE